MAHSLLRVSQRAYRLGLSSKQRLITCPAISQFVTFKEKELGDETVWIRRQEAFKLNLQKAKQKAADTTKSKEEHLHDQEERAIHELLDILGPNHLPEVRNSYVCAFK